MLLTESVFYQISNLLNSKDFSDKFKELSSSDSSTLKLVESYLKILNLDLNSENINEQLNLVSADLKSIDFDSTVKNVCESLNVNLKTNNKLDTLVKELSDNKNFMNDYSTIKKEIDTISQIKTVLGESKKINSFLTEFDGSFKNDVLISAFKTQIKENYPSVSDRVLNYVDVSLTESEDSLKDFHVKNINEAIKNIDNQMLSEGENVDLLKAKNKLLNLLHKSNGSVDQMDVLKVISLLDNYQN